MKFLFAIFLLALPASFCLRFNIQSKILMVNDGTTVMKRVASVCISGLLSCAIVQSTSPFFSNEVSSVTLVAPAFADSIPVIGSIAPDFSLPSNYGKELSLKDFSNTRKGDFTQGCTIEAQGFQRDIAKYKELGVQIVGVSVDSVDKHLDFGKKYGLDFPLLSDQGGVVSGKYGSLLDFGFVGKFSNRQTYIISPDNKIEYVFTDVESRVAQHSEDVLEKLKNLK